MSLFFPKLDLPEQEVDKIRQVRKRGMSRHPSRSLPIPHTSTSSDKYDQVEQKIDIDNLWNNIAEEMPNRKQQRSRFPHGEPATSWGNPDPVKEEKDMSLLFSDLDLPKKEEDMSLFFPKLDLPDKEVDKIRQVRKRGMSRHPSRSLPIPHTSTSSGKYDKHVKEEPIGYSDDPLDVPDLGPIEDENIDVKEEPIEMQHRYSLLGASLDPPHQ